MTTILLKLAGPLQAYGIDSHFETRQTQRYPSKSAIIGIIAASLGFRRNQDDEIQMLNQLDFVVRVDQPGELLRDFHTAHAIKKDGSPNRTYVSHRYYLQDAVFIIAISGEETVIQKVAKALKSPYFQPFMGRRSLPLNSDFFMCEVDETPITVLKNLEWQAAKWYQKKNKNVSQLDLYADANLLDSGEILMPRDRVISFSQEKRQHGFRPIKHIRISVIKKEIATTHDVFSAIEGGL
ncbi:type I-E CRISPR-associated protein Cas5/CasD [Pseudolactococcus reticulitermitis]|uniref:CRISPR-associated protein Cas5e family n=1 Tax=Pseudolactococcus reticulitermitis TaxID=2025039 RepID=A0A224XA18_9LACT|nr:type I-E CRISPR-associated protein Cas5/CasD [Lactococcus reticulitermitis]GAX46541.1 CRISPR-associated protein Cas5e family [Lactococcus reticulitermitis]